MDQLEWARPRESYYAEKSRCNLFHFLLQLSVRFVNNISISHSHFVRSCSLFNYSRDFPRADFGMCFVSLRLRCHILLTGESHGLKTRVEISFMLHNTALCELKPALPEFLRPLYLALILCVAN